MISWKVNSAFRVDSDKNSHDHVAALLERGVDVLIYVGTYDNACNWIGNNEWTLDLEWSGQNGFVKEPLKPWTVQGKKAGMTRGSGRFVFVTVDGAGHMV